MHAEDPFRALAVALLPPGRRDGRRVALIEEGGGIRGAFGAGVQAGFADAGLGFAAFDALYGTSAGALNLMYWVSRAPHVGCGVYVEDLIGVNGRSFFLHTSPLDLLSRLRRGLAALDVSAVGHAMSVTRPIDPRAVRDHRAPIFVPIARSEDLRGDMLDVRALPESDLLPTLLAGASVPVLADPARVGGAEIFDGAFLDPLPVRRAIADGCTDLVVILTLPRWRHPPSYEEWILRALASRRRVSDAVARAVTRGRRARRDAIAALRRPPPGVAVTVIAPAVLLGRSLERRQARIRRLVDAGVEAGRLAVELARLSGAR